MPPARYADLHLHSRHARATSPQMTPAGMHLAALRKGVAILGTGDLTHPAWRAELRAAVAPAEPGFFRLKQKISRPIDAALPATLRGDCRFALSGEVACFYRRGGRSRRVHLCLLAPAFAAAERFCRGIAPLGDLAADGRPALAADAEAVAAIALDAGLEVFPAHVLTPHFSAFGGAAGFAAPEEAFGELAPRLLALETGLSADPPMLRRIPAFARHALLSNSDAHSPERIGREANRFDSASDYAAMVRAIRTGDGFAGTIEFFPEEGKYHLDGHRACGVALRPDESRRLGGRCPVCGRPVTPGVRGRAEALAAASRPRGARRAAACPERPHRTFVPLLEILAEIDAVKGAGARARRRHDRLLAEHGPELAILGETPLPDLESSSELLALAIGRMREGAVALSPGYDGRYGRVRLLAPDGENGGLDVPGQLPLF